MAQTGWWSCRRLLMKDGNNNMDDKRLSLKLQRLLPVASLEMAPRLCCGAKVGSWAIRISN